MSKSSQDKPKNWTCRSPSRSAKRKLASRTRPPPLWTPIRPTMPAQSCCKERTSKRFPMIRTTCSPICRLSLALPPAQMAARSTLTASPAASFHPKPLSEKFASTRIHFPRNTTSSRSEEHTSELQSRQYLVCRLLLEKKKHTAPTQQL